jgi:hypothetical protein
MQRCGSCGRYLLVGEVFQMFRRKLRREAAVVCEPCTPFAMSKGWKPVGGPAWRQLTRRARVYRPRPSITSASIVTTPVRVS